MDEHKRHPKDRKDTKDACDVKNSMPNGPVPDLSQTAFQTALQTNPNIRFFYPVAKNNLIFWLGVSNWSEFLDYLINLQVFNQATSVPAIREWAKYFAPQFQASDAIQFEMSRAKLKIIYQNFPIEAATKNLLTLGFLRAFLPQEFIILDNFKQSNQDQYIETFIKNCYSEIEHAKDHILRYVKLSAFFSVLNNYFEKLVPPSIFNDGYHFILKYKRNVQNPYFYYSIADQDRPEFDQYFTHFNQKLIELQKFQSRTKTLTNISLGYQQLDQKDAPPSDIVAPNKFSIASNSQNLFNAQSQKTSQPDQSGANQSNQERRKSI